MNTQLTRLSCCDKSIVFLISQKESSYDEWSLLCFQSAVPLSTLHFIALKFQFECIFLAESRNVTIVDFFLFRIVILSIFLLSYSIINLLHTYCNYHIRCNHFTNINDENFTRKRKYMHDERVSLERCWIICKVVITIKPCSLSEAYIFSAKTRRVIGYR